MENRPLELKGYTTEEKKSAVDKKKQQKTVGDRGDFYLQES